MLIWRFWMKATLILTLMVGCNTVAPALAASSDHMPSIELASCHGASQTGSGEIVTCKTTCLAVLPASQPMNPPEAIVQSFGRAAFASFRPSEFRPETPPPRLA